MPLLLKNPKREHAQYRQAAITISFVWKNPNPPHIFDCTDRELESRMTTLVEKNLVSTMFLDVKNKRGFLPPDFLKEWTDVRVNVKTRECTMKGQPRNLLARAWYWITGRYFY